jgi:Spy/CpxP family protein refolding chaperone
MKRTLMRVATVAVLVAGGVLAQGPEAGSAGSPPEGRRPSRIEFLARRLNLTDAQKQQASKILSAGEEKRTELRKSLKQARQDLNNVVVKAGPSDEQIDKLAQAMGALVGQLAATDAKERSKLRALLTTEQREEYDRLPSPVGYMMRHGFGIGQPPRGGVGFMHHDFVAGPPPGPLPPPPDMGEPPLPEDPDD